MGFAPHWYSINSGVLYPIDEAASARDDSGKLLPTNLLVDLAVRWPVDLGQYAFVSAIAVTQTLVTILLQSADDLGDPGFAPLASVTLPQPVQPGVAYPFDAQTSGVGGWVVFGPGVMERLPYQGRFSTAAQTRLAPRAARSYRRLPVSSLQIAYAATKLSDVVGISAQSPLTVTKESREIDGIYRDVMVVSLVESNSANPVPTAQAQALGVASPSVFEQFAGPCGGRPESGTCSDPQPIEFIDAVGPDCEGTLIIRFTGCARISQILDTCGVVIDCGAGLSTACLPPELPDYDGTLPSDYSPVTIPTPPTPPEPPEPTGSDSFSSGTALPYLNCLSPTHIDELIVEVGAWQAVGDGTDPERPSGCVGAFSGSSESAATLHEWAIETSTAATRNVVIWTGDVSSVYRRVTAGVRILTGPPGAKRNAGIVLNWRASAVTEGLFVYWLAAIDYDSQQIQLSYFDGATLAVIANLFVPGIAVERWYKLTATVLPGPTTDETVVQVHALDVEAGIVNDALTTVISGYRPSTGDMGLGNNRGLARFSYLMVEEYDL